MQKRRILVVDNNDELRALLEQVLGNLGHEVVVTGEREQALAREDLDEFDLVISDLTEAEVNGQAIGDLQRKRLVTPVSSPNGEPTIIKAFKMGAVNYLRSPYNHDELREIVEQTLSYKLRYVDDPSLLSHFHEKIEFAEDYRLSQKVQRKRFSIVRGGVYTTNRRFQRMGHLRVGWLFLWTAMNFWNERHFLRDHKYWANGADSLPRA